MSAGVLSLDPTRRTNAQAIVDAHTLGYVGDRVLDVTHNIGRFWRNHTPELLVRCDLATGDSKGPFPIDVQCDMTALPFAADSFDTTVCDPPYKLNGSGGSHASDEGYGVADTWAADNRLGFYAGALPELIRVTRTGGHLLVKAQDQCVSAKFVRQCGDLAVAYKAAGLTELAPLHVFGHRAQPKGKAQRNALASFSSLLVFKVARAAKRCVDHCPECNKEEP